MKTRKWFFVGLASSLALLFLVATAISQGAPTTARAQGDISLTGTVNARISYQGVLTENGSPVMGTRDMAFRLYSDQSCTTLVDTIFADNVAVSDGLFTVHLDVDPGDFSGQGLWLQVQVDSIDLGCQEILPVPYALSLRPGARVMGDVAGGNVVEVENSGSADGTAALLGNATATSGRTAGIEGRVSSNTFDAAGVYGYSYHEGTSGVRGQSQFGSGIIGETLEGHNEAGVWGHAAADTGRTFGVYGSTLSTWDDSAGVRGVAAANSGITYGVSGRADSPQGAGIQGTAPLTGVVGIHTDGQQAGTGVYGQSSTWFGGYGVYGKGYEGLHGDGGMYGVYGSGEIAIWGEGVSTGVHGRGDDQGVYGEGQRTGVYGTAPYTGTVGIATDPLHQRSVGVYGESPAAWDGAGVYGVATARAGGDTYGVQGLSNSEAGAGVHGTAPSRGTVGIATNASGTADGVYGETASTSGRGVMGYATASTGETRGVYGRTDSTTDWTRGVYGYASAASGLTLGVYGRTESSTDWASGVYGRATATSGRALGIFGRTDSSGDWASGVYGYAPATTGTVVGVYGRTDSTTGLAVYGYAASTSGRNYGVYGATASSGDFAAGVSGTATAFSGQTRGVYGLTESSSDLAVGVRGDATASSGQTRGVVGITDSSTDGAIGVAGQANAGSGRTYGVRGINSSVGGRGLYGIASADSGDRIGVVGEVEGTGYGLYTYDNLYVAGNCTGCSTSFIGRNVSDVTLRIGDVVTVEGVGAILKGQSAPVLHVRRATDDDAAVLGVVYSRGVFYAATGSGLEDDGDSVHPEDGDVAPGDYVLVVTSGLAQVRLAPSLLQLTPGQRLTVGASAGLALLAKGDTKPDLVFARAMESEPDENGLLWAMITVE